MASTSKLPVVEGVAPSRQRLPAGPWVTVLDFLKERFPLVCEEVWLRRMAEGRVTDEAGQRLDAASPYRAGACIFYYREVEREERIPFDERILYRDEHLLAVDKPHFLPVVPAGRFARESLLARLKMKGMPEDLVPVHRIDRETAGVVLFSLNTSTRGRYTALFRKRMVEKIYEALAPTLRGVDFPLTRRSRIVRGEPFFRMKEEAGEPNSETRVEVLEDVEDATRYRLIPITGRKHQLRLHMASMGAALINDRLYPVTLPAGPDDFSRPLKLLARSVAFRDPLSGRECYFESEQKL